MSTTPHPTTKTKTTKTKTKPAPPAGDDPAIIVRRMDFPFDDTELPRYWFAGSPFLTHLINGLNFVFPGGERFFIRSVKRYEGQLEDEALRERVRAFAGQEAEHQREHRRAFALLEAQGYEVERFLDWYHEVAYKRLEPRFGAPMRLATTVALEHFTALFGELALGTDLLDEAHPIMRDLLLWHAAEEIEHKSVAFDVFQAVDGRYGVRVAGYAIALATLAVFWTAGARHLLRQEPRQVRRSSRREARRDQRSPLRFFARHRRLALSRALDFLRPGFHPDQHDNYALAREHFARIGRVDA